MVEISSDSTAEDIEALEAFVLDNPELERLEDLLDPFNIFEAIGVTRQELRHSHFLSYLLDPSENHGLGDYLTRKLLQAALRPRSRESLPISLVDLDVWNFDEVEILREWKNIDILVRDPANQLLVIIENKIGTSEHSNQLKRYWNEMEQDHPGWKVIGLYLTPEGSSAESDERYAPVSYDTIVRTLDTFVESRGTSIGEGIRTLIAHYTQMIRRHVVENSEVARLSQSINQKHRRALDLIYEFRPDLQAQVRDCIMRLVATQPTLVQDHCTKQYVRFAHAGWDETVLANGDGRWTPSKRMMLFEFNNGPKRLMLTLNLGPGPEATRMRLFEALKTKSPFKPAFKALGASWNQVWQLRILKESDYAEATPEQIIEIVEKAWTTFVGGALHQLVDGIAEERWLWDEKAGEQQT